jgi:putative membrane protein
LGLKFNKGATVLRIALVAFGIISFVSLSFAQDAKEHKGGKDHEFVMKAAAGGELEVALGKLAADKATNADVKKFGQQMVDDHSKANDELKALAQSKNIDLSKAQEKAMKKADAEKEKLEKKSGADFDKAYMKMMVADHEKDVKEFEEASKHAEDVDIKAFAAKTLPTLQHHLDMAKETQSKLST